MKITFLGTGTSQGIPVIGSTDPVCLSLDSKDKRLRSSIMMTWQDYRFVIDCGPDFRQQMLRESISEVNGILFTHEHADHTAGLDDIRPFCHKKGDMPLYVPERIINNFEQRFDYIFAKENRYRGAPSASIKVVENKSFCLGNKTIQPIEFMHGKISVFGYRIDDFAYVTDLKSISKQEKEKLKNLDVLVLNALRKEPHPTHLSLDDALNLIEELQPKKAYLTHISHKLGFHAEVQKVLPNNVFLGYDGLSFEV
ncbi:MAG TPA: MBL fold metallo-hydrolase [Flavobacteriaceae bacterium]|jgi:phosphoribosyl 1,2-cyclic phosphate phosphodiesterase|nr:MBL fold metallo-hydrolase [Flavobacteriaceae bacterium]HBS13231.1 MBL fold metallo-hydrolase [Flavobacteriaceae bacterium]